MAHTILLFSLLELLSSMYTLLLMISTSWNEIGLYNVYFAISSDYS